MFEYVTDITFIRYAHNPKSGRTFCLRLLNDYYVIYRGEKLRVPEEFKTDLASFPSIPILNITFGSKLGPSMEAAVVHDYLYSKQCQMGDIGRGEADRIFLEGMKSANMPKWQAYLYYYGVRLFGWRHYKKS